MSRRTITGDRPGPRPRVRNALVTAVVCASLALAADAGLAASSNAAPSAVASAAPNTASSAASESSAGASAAVASGAAVAPAAPSGPSGAASGPAAGPASGVTAGDTRASGTRVYAFHALLDGKPIGEHRFQVTTAGGTRKVTSEANFAVKVLGIQAYRYHHHAEEHWSGDCLTSLSSTTDDDGKPESVHLQREGDTDRITTAAGSKSVTGCLMSYAYWNPALRTQTRLLNPQTGKVDAVHVERVRNGTLGVGGKDVPATLYRIIGGDASIDVWYSEHGDWIGLDSTVGGKHQLSYRLP